MSLRSRRAEETLPFVPPSDRPRPRSLASGSDSAELKPARIVVADDDRVTRELLANALRNAGHTVEVVEDGQEAIERVGQGGVDLVMLDIVMPRLGGLEACRLIKSMTSEGFLPVVLCTVRTDTASRVEGLRIGADDYVCKPFEEAELNARVQAMLRIKRLHDQVSTQRAKFERLSVHDEMTGLYNYRYLNTRLTEEFKRAERYHEPFACVVVDIDQLRLVNDSGGRPLGDAAIRFVADGIRRCVRDVDVVARYGGEEFLLVLPSTHFAGSVVVAERIWREVSGKPIDVDWEARRGEAPGKLDAPTAAAPTAAAPARASFTNEASRGSFTNEANLRTPTPVAEIKRLSVDRVSQLDLSRQAAAAFSNRPFTVSIGVALYPSRDVRTKDALLRAADQALSQAKREGGNRICVFQQQGYIYTPAITPQTAPAARRPASDAPESNRKGS
jgi:two-component system, cell cycle response regulator